MQGLLNRYAIFISLLVVFWGFFSVAAQAIEITDSSGKHRFDAPPQRVVVVNWTLTEQVLALGIIPVGVAEITAYNKTVPVLPIPDDVVEVGNRQAPKLDTIKSLDPDVIIIGYSQKSLMRPLSRIAPVLYFKNFSRRYDNAAVAVERLETLGQLFARESEAKQVIEKLAYTRQTMAEQVNLRYARQRPVITALQYEVVDCCWLHDNNSLIRSVLDGLGFTSGWQQPPSNFGVRKVSADDVLKKDRANTYWLLWGNGEVPQTLANAAMIEQNRYWQLPALWGYGGVASLTHLYQQIGGKLLE